MAEKILVICADSLNNILHRILSNDQFKLRTKPSTVHQISGISNYVTDNFNFNKYTGMLLTTNIAKTLDVAWLNEIFM